MFKGALDLQLMLIVLNLQNLYAASVAAVKNPLMSALAGNLKRPNLSQTRI